MNKRMSEEKLFENFEEEEIRQNHRASLTFACRRRIECYSLNHFFSGVARREKKSVNIAISWNTIRVFRTHTVFLSPSPFLFHFPMLGGFYSLFVGGD